MDVLNLLYRYLKIFASVSIPPTIVSRARGNAFVGVIIPALEMIRSVIGSLWPERFIWFDCFEVSSEKRMMFPMRYRLKQSSQNLSQENEPLSPNGFRNLVIIGIEWIPWYLMIEVRSMQLASSWVRVMQHPFRLTARVVSSSNGIWRERKHGLKWSWRMIFKGAL